MTTCLVQVKRYKESHKYKRFVKKSIVYDLYFLIGGSRDIVHRVELINCRCPLNCKV